MFSRREFISEPFVVEPHYKNLCKLTYIINNEDDFEREQLTNYLRENNCEFRCYWQSKFDRNIIEVNEPKIYDAFNCVIIAIGDIKDIMDSIGKYQIRNDRVDYLERCLCEGNIERKKRWINVEREKRNINYEKLANSIIASLYPQQ